MTQTAVSEMFAQIKAARKDTQFWNDSMLVDWLLESEERFKSTEKQQLMNSYWDGGIDIPNSLDCCQKYIKETYGGNK